MARIAQLEGKLDGLMSQLASNRGLTNDFQSQVAGQGTISPPPSVSSSSPTAAGASTAADPELPDEAETTECLDTFRSHFLGFFPFLHLPDNCMTWLREQRPFLLLCIVTASSKSTQRKLALGEIIRRTLANKVFLDNDPSALSIDHLLGLLTFLTWGHDHLLHSMPARVSRLTHMAMTLAFDLRLSKPLPDAMSNMLPTGGIHSDCSTQQRPTRSMEERRAVLACYLLSSLISSYFGQADTMQWTPYMEECLDLVGSNPETPNDELFVLQLRLQRIAGEAEAHISSSATVPELYVSALQYKVDGLVSRIPPTLQHNPILLSSIYYTRLCIHTLGIMEQLVTGLRDLNAVCACLDTVKSALENFFEMGISEYPGIAFPMFTHLARYIVVLFKLSTLRDPMWNTSLVRSKVDLVQVMDKLLSNVQQATAMEGEQSLGGPLDRSAKIFMAVKLWCEANMFEDLAGRDLSSSNRGIDTSALQLEDEWFRDEFAQWMLDVNQRVF